MSSADLFKQPVGSGTFKNAIGVGGCILAGDTLPSLAAKEQTGISRSLDLYRS